MDINKVTSPTSLMEMLRGYQVSQAIYVAAKLGIADLVKDGPKRSAELAEATGTDARSLYRFLRALASRGVFAEDAAGRFGLTPLAELLQTDVPGSMRPVAIMWCQPWQWQTWGSLLYSVQTGETAFRHLYGMSQYEYLAKHPDSNAIFNAAMVALARARHSVVAAAYNFSGMSRVIDVGGGHGALLAAILQTNPSLRGILFDAPHVVADAKAHFEAAEVADRCEIVGGDFFASVPEGGDAYILSSVLMDWDDDRAVAILRNCRRAMVEQGKLLIVEPLIAPGNEASSSKFLDLAMLVVNGGRLRTEPEFRTLLATANFRMMNTISTQAGRSIIEGVR
ncbi:MAG: methyltransferase [bacterium]